MDFLNASRGGHPSWVWNSILEGISLSLEGLRWQIGDGFGKINGFLHYQISKLFLLPPHNCSISKVSDLISFNCNECKLNVIYNLFDKAASNAILWALVKGAVRTV